MAKPTVAMKEMISPRTKLLIFKYTLEQLAAGRINSETAKSPTIAVR
jgi:hypothetical protein